MQFIKDIFNSKEALNRILVTLGILFIIRIGNNIPVPFINLDVVTSAFEGLQFAQLMNTFSGGALSSFSIFALSVSPYITATIIIQLLSADVIPALAEWQKEGESGKQKINRVTRYLTLTIAFISGLGLAGYLSIVSSNTIFNGGADWMNYVYVATTLTAGASLVMFLANQITKNGIGNGTSLVIVSGILVMIPKMGAEISSQVSTAMSAGGAEAVRIMASLAIVIILLLIVLIGATYMQLAERQIPIKHANKNTLTSAQAKSYIPFKLNAAGVIPVIFAMSFITLPQTISGLFPDSSFLTSLSNLLDITSVSGATIYVFLIIAFSFFYVLVQIKPEDVADNLRKSGAYIPEIRPGKETEEYITNVLMRITLFGSVYLAILAIMPIIATNVMGLPSAFAISGTSLIIVIGVAIETYKKIKSAVTKKEYELFRRY